MSTGAFDDVRPPEPSLIEDCVHCGFCLPTCPTYVLWDEEMDSPRGRVLLMRTGHEEGPELSVAQVQAWDNCLGCMACVTACPSGVQYDKLIEDTRQQVERRFARPRLERLHRRAPFTVFPHPARLRALAPLLSAQRALRLDRIAERIPALAPLVRLQPRTPLRETWRRLPVHTPAQGPRRGRAGFMQGCVQRVFFSQVNVATVEVLAAEGWDVFAPVRPGCCGALELHTGFGDEARGRARRTIAAFEDCDVVAVNAAGCGSAMKDYGHMLRDDPEWAQRAAAFSEKVRDVTELLAERDPVAERRPVELGAAEPSRAVGRARSAEPPRAEGRPAPLVVAYHDACHLAHAQGVRAQPRDLLLQIPGLELREPAEWELCCGSAGVYNLLKPKPAAELGERKARNLLATGAQAIVAANPGCALQITAHTTALGHEIPVFHPMELLHASLTGRRLTA
jgi:glycolate oxidase iron-sulfur subunit